MTKLTLATLALIAAPALAFAECTAKHQTTASACAEGQIYDPVVKGCINASS